MTRALLFDLDGTLVDSAPDLAGTANDMLALRGMPALPYEQLRPHAGSGARGMLWRAFGAQPGDERFVPLRDEFHDRYEQRMLRDTGLFDTVRELLSELSRRGVPWGIVTNKSLRFAAPMVQAFRLQPPGGVLIGGDSTPHTKPHPAPLLEGARQLGVEPAHCVYLGDDPRDMQAAHAAGMLGWAAAWGYLGVQVPLSGWSAHQVLQQPKEILNFLDLP
jgi:N-acetyl-D-muramate 6-phosphate phosphatase